jgi:hypothetical protein
MKIYENNLSESVLREFKININFYNPNSNFVKLRKPDEFCLNKFLLTDDLEKTLTFYCIIFYGVFLSYALRSK